MNEWIRNLYEKCWWCNLRRTGYGIGWLGVVYRIVAILAIAILISELPKTANVSLILFSLLLAYLLLSLIANFAILIGINKRNHQYFILYLGVFGVELGLIVILFIGGIIFFVDLGTPEVLSYFIPSGLVFLGVYFYLWLCLVRLFEELKSANEESNSTKSLASDLGSFECSLSCFKSASLDIVAE